MYHIDAQSEVGIYTQRTTHGLCAVFLLLGDIAEEYSTFKAQCFTSSVSPSAKLLQRFRRLKKHGLLEVVPPKQDLELGFGDVQVCGVVPTLAISMAFAFEDDAKKTPRPDYTAELAALGLTTIPRATLQLANAYYYNDRANNIRHESICSGHVQPPYGWRVCTIPGMFSCECNFFYKKKFCIHLLLALESLEKDFAGAPLPPTTFSRNEPQRRTEAAPRFTGPRATAITGDRNVRRGRTVGRPLDMH